MFCSVLEFALCAHLIITNRFVSDHGLQQHVQSAEFRHLRIDVLQNRCGHCSVWSPKKKKPRPAGQRFLVMLASHHVSSMRTSHRRTHHLAFLHATLRVIMKSSDRPDAFFHELDQAASCKECIERFYVTQEQDPTQRSSSTTVNQTTNLNSRPPCR